MLRITLRLAAVAFVAGCSAGGGEFVGTWTNPAGQPASSGKHGNERYELQAFRGAEHCDWTSVVFLVVAWPPGTVATPSADGPHPSERTYVRDPKRAIGGVTYEGTLDLEAALPSGSQATGYRRGAAELWLGPDDGARFAYLKDGDTIERWPRALEPPACA